MMPSRSRRLVPAIALVLSGCAIAPGLAPTSSQDVAFRPMANWSEDAAGAPHYGLLAASNPRATVTSVVASSTKNAFFQAGYAVDGNFHSAWAPAAGDAHPSLLITLVPFNLSGGSILIKASHQSGSTAPIGAHFDIKNVGQNFFDFGGFFVTPAVPGSLDIHHTPIGIVEQVRVTFNTSDLLVCEVEFFQHPL